MSTITSFSYSYDNIDNVTVNKKIEYKTTYKDNENNIWFSTYTNNTVNEDMHESFNKLFKSNQEEIKEQSGISKNQSDWKIIEYNNAIKDKEYTETYDKYPYYNYYLQDNLHNINTTTFPQIKDK